MTPPTPTPVLACCGAPDRPGWSLHASWCQAAADARWSDVQARYDAGVAWAVRRWVL